MKPVFCKPLGVEFHQIYNLAASLGADGDSRNGLDFEFKRLKVKVMTRPDMDGVQFLSDNFLYSAEKSAE